MAQQTWVRGYRLVFAGLTAVAIVYQLAKNTGSISNFFSYFTIQSNIIGAIVLLIGAMMVRPPMEPESTSWTLVRGGAAIYLMLTGVIYNTLLRDVDVQVSAQWVNETLHTIMPIVMLVDLLLAPLANRLTLRQALGWTVYPLLYLMYSLLRGPIVDWYPYPFVDPRKDGGYPRVALFCIVILLGFLGVTWVLVRLSNWRHDRADI